MAKTYNLTHERLLQVLEYEPETGLFRWLVSNSARVAVGDVAGCLDKSINYIKIRIDDRLYYAHRLAFFYMTKRWPMPKCDHADGDGANNRWGNLREATHTQNQANSKLPVHNSSGLKGASLRKDTGRYQARISINNRYVSLGCYDSIEDAHGAYRKKAESIHGKFARMK